VAEQSCVHRQDDGSAGLGLGDLAKSRHGRTVYEVTSTTLRNLHCLTVFGPIVCNERNTTGGLMAATRNTNTQFELRGINHLALVCRDMAETVAWYEDVLGMKLVKTLELPGGRGQHFFLDMGNGVDGIAFFWFPDAPDGVFGESIQGRNGM